MKGIVSLVLLLLCLSTIGCSITQAGMLQPADSNKHSIFNREDTTILIPDTITKIVSGFLAHESFSEQTKLYFRTISIIIPQTVLYIDPNALKNISNPIDSIVVAANNPNYSSLDGVLYNKDKTQLLWSPPAKKKEKLDIPSSVKEIYWGALEGCFRLTSIYIPDSVKFIIGTHNQGIGLMDWNSKLTEINVSEKNPYYSSQDGLLYNKDKTELIYCPRAKKGKIIIPGSVRKIDNKALNYCSATSITLNDSVNVAKHYFFHGCEKLSEIITPESNPYCSSEEGILYNKDKTEIIYLPPNLQKDIYLSPKLKVIKKIYSLNVSEYAHNFAIHVPASVERIEDYAFSGSKIPIKIDFPNSIKYIGAYAFDGNCNIDSISLNAVQEIGISAFSGNDGFSHIKSITITSDSLSRLYGAFIGCEGIKEVTITTPKPPALVPQIGEDSNFFDFSGADLSNCTLRVAKGTRRAYKKAPVWKKFGHIVEIK